MLTVEHMGPPDTARRCRTCNRRIVWAATYTGRKLPFDPDPAPRALDYEHTGWIPGRFDIEGHLRTVFAPLPLHPHTKRRRASHVMLLHACDPAKAAA